MSVAIDEARRVATSLLDDLENGTHPAERVLMKAKRLARLMRDGDAQTWLDYETQGYPANFSIDELGTCRRYAERSGRYTAETSKYYLQSLPALEALCEGNEASIRSFQTKSGSSPTMENYLVKRATEEFIAGQMKLQQGYREAFQKSKSLVVALRSGIHNYVTDTHLALTLGDIAQEVFERARNDVDAFVRAHCPKAAEQLIAINDRMADNSAESRTAALTTCRRLLMTVADSLFPPRPDRGDASGKVRKLGPEQYKNRLLAYLEDASSSDNGSQDVVVSGLEHLAARLDAIYEKTCKGVHVDVTEQEARLAVIHTYLFLGEIANSATSIIPATPA
jgi:hypothetical protein